MNSAAVKFVHKFLLEHLPSVLQGMCPEVELLGHIIRYSMFNLLTQDLPDFFTAPAPFFIFPPAISENYYIFLPAHSFMSLNYAYLHCLGGNNGREE